MTSLENQCRAYSLDGSVVPEKQERPSSVGAWWSWFGLWVASVCQGTEDGGSAFGLREGTIGLLSCEKRPVEVCSQSRAEQSSAPPEQSPVEDQGSQHTCSQAWLAAQSSIISMERWHGDNSASDEIRNFGGIQSAEYWVPVKARIGFCFSIHEIIRGGMCICGWHHHLPNPLFCTKFLLFAFKCTIFLKLLMLMFKGSPGKESIQSHFLE